MILFGKWIQNGIPTFGRVCRQRRTFRAVRNVSQMLLRLRPVGYAPEAGTPILISFLFPQPAALP